MRIGHFVLNDQLFQCALLLGDCTSYLDSLVIRFLAGTKFLKIALTTIKITDNLQVFGLALKY